MKPSQFSRFTVIAACVAGLNISFAQDKKTSGSTQAGQISPEKADQKGEPKASKNDIRVVEIYLVNIDREIGELNGREALAWGTKSLEEGGYTDDAAVFKNVDQKLGRDYTFAGTATTGALSYQGIKKVALKRTPSTAQSPAVWDILSREQEQKELLTMMKGPAREKLFKSALAYRNRAIEAAIAELNGREALAWAEQMLRPEGYVNDAVIFKAVGLFLGDHYSLKGTNTGWLISFKGKQKTNLKRTPSSANSPATWERVSDE